jgi:hypothetical protein
MLPSSAKLQAFLSMQAGFLHMKELSPSIPMLCPPEVIAANIHGNPL